MIVSCYVSRGNLWWGHSPFYWCVWNMCVEVLTVELWKILSKSQGGVRGNNGTLSLWKHIQQFFFGVLGAGHRTPFNLATPIKWTRGSRNLILVRLVRSCHRINLSPVRRVLPHSTVLVCITWLSVDLTWWHFGFLSIFFLQSHQFENENMSMVIFPFVTFLNLHHSAVVVLPVKSLWRVNFEFSDKLDKCFCFSNGLLLLDYQMAWILSYFQATTWHLELHSVLVFF